MSASGDSRIFGRRESTINLSNCSFGQFVRRFFLKCSAVPATGRIASKNALPGPAHSSPTMPALCGQPVAQGAEDWQNAVLPRRQTRFGDVAGDLGLDLISYAYQ